jgi:hypothetical protein
MSIDAVGAVGATTLSPVTGPSQNQILQEQRRVQDQQDQAQRQQQIQEQQRAQADQRARADEARLAADRTAQTRSQQQTQAVNGRTDILM